MYENNENDYQAIRSVLDVYAKGHGGDESLTREILNIFHPTAKMTGYINGEMVTVGPDFIVNFVLGCENPDDEFSDYIAVVQNIEVFGMTATARVVGKGISNFGNFVDNFLFAKDRNGSWKIMSKIFSFN